MKKQQYGIRKVKTWHGMKWGVVDLKAPFGSDVVETKNKIALFQYNEEGLDEAREFKSFIKVGED